MKYLETSFVDYINAVKKKKFNKKIVHFFK